MISATILNILNDHATVAIEYVLLDDKDANYNAQGTLTVPLGWTTSDITTAIIPIVDAANYAASLKPLLNMQIISPNLAPDPAQPIKPMGVST